MQKLTLHIALLLALTLPRPLSAQTPTQEELRREYTTEHPLVYEDAWDLWPYVFLDDEGNPAGYNVDLLEMIFDELDIPYVINLKPTVRALEDLRDGKSDLMLGMVANYHDDFSLHYGNMVIQLFTHSVVYPVSEQKRIHAINDLAQQQVIVHEGSFSHHLMEDRGWGMNAIPMGDMDKAVQMVSADNSGQVLWNTMSLKWLLHKYHADNLRIEPVDMPSGDYRFMANDAKLLEMMEATLKHLKASDRLMPLEQKWFYPEKAVSAGTPQWLWYLVMLIALFMLAFFAASIFFNIRSRKMTREVRRRNNRLALTLQICQVKIWTFDVNRHVFTWYGNNAQVKRTYSIKEFGQRYHTEDFERLKEALRSIAEQKKEHVSLEMNAMDGEDGEERSYIITLSALHSEKGVPRIIIGTKSDVTEKCRQQEKRQQLMHRYKAIFTTAMIDMVYYDSNGYIEDMNERVQSTFKMSLDKVLEEHVKLSDILDERIFAFKDFATTDRFYATLQLDYSKDRQLESRKREGTLTYELQLVPVFDNQHNILGAYGTGRDVTEMVQTYHRAKENVAQLRLAMQKLAKHVDNINLALQVGGVRLVSYSPKTHVLAVNHRLHEAQYILTQQRCLQLVHPDFLGQVMPLFRMMDRGDKRSLNLELRTNLRVAGGKALWLQLHLFPVLNDAGTVIHYDGIFRDHTEIKHTEWMLQQETAKAQEVEQVKSQFLHNMCYEIRTPLNIVVGYAEMFENGLSAEEEQVFIKEIKDNSAYLLSLINDILFLSRLDAHMVEITPQPCDFAQTFEGHCQMALANNQHEGVRYVVDNPFEKLVVCIDDANVGRVIHQLMENAAKYTLSGTVHASYQYVGGRLLIGIEDSGSGIPPEKMEHIFERFNNPSDNNRGTGLGLPICKELLDQLGGTIDISSEVGRGTNVWISIPCEATAAVHKKDF